MGRPVRFLIFHVQTADQPFPGVPNLSKPRAIQPLKLLIFPVLPHKCHFSRFSAPHPVRSHVQIFDLGSTGYLPILGRFVSKLEPAFPPIKGGPDLIELFLALMVLVVWNLGCYWNLITMSYFCQLRTTGDSTDLAYKFRHHPREGSIAILRLSASHW